MEKVTWVNLGRNLKESFRALQTGPFEVETTMFRNGNGNLVDLFSHIMERIYTEKYIYIFRVELLHEENSGNKCKSGREERLLC